MGRRLIRTTLPGEISKGPGEAGRGGEKAKPVGGGRVAGHDLKQSLAELSLSLTTQGTLQCESLLRVILTQTRELSPLTTPPSIISQEPPVGDLNSQAQLALC